MSNNLGNTVFVYQHCDTGEIRALYLDDAHVLSGREGWLHVGTLEPRAWIEANWRRTMAAPDLRRALQRMVEYERGQDRNLDRVGALYAADVALNKALGDAEWPM